MTIVSRETERNFSILGSDYDDDVISAHQRRADPVVRSDVKGSDYSNDEDKERTTQPDRKKKRGGGEEKCVKRGYEFCGHQVLYINC